MSKLHRFFACLIRNGQSHFGHGRMVAVVEESMKFVVLAIMLLTLPQAWALNDYLTPEDQPHYQNDSNGKNNLDRIDANVREINRLWGEIIALKAEVKKLQERLDAKEAAAAGSVKKP